AEGVMREGTSMVCVGLNTAGTSVRLRDLTVIPDQSRQLAVAVAIHAGHVQLDSCHIRHKLGGVRVTGDSASLSMDACVLLAAPVSRGTSVLITEGASATIEQTEFTGVCLGVDVTDDASVSVGDCRFSGCEVGVGARSGSAKIERCEFRACEGAVQATSSRLEVAETRIDASAGDALWLSDRTQAQLREVEIERPIESGHGVHVLDRSSVQAIDVKVSGCHCAVAVRDEAFASATRLVIDDCSSNAAEVTSGSTLELTEPLIDGGASIGIEITPRSTARVDGGSISGCERTAIYVGEGCRLEARRSRVRENRIGVTLCGGSTGEISDCDFSGNEQSALQTGGVSAVTLTDNVELQSATSAPPPVEAILSA